MIKLIKAWFCFSIAPLYFGGGGGSASTSNNTTTNNTDKRLVVSDNAIGVSADNSTVRISSTTTDLGAIGGAFDFAKSANADNAANYENLLSTTSTAMRDLIGAQNSGLNSILNGVGSMQNFIASTAASATGQMDNRTKMIIGLAGLGVVALLAWGKK
jgi:hypothetical protein